MLSLPAGRVARFVIAGVWILLMVAAGAAGLPEKFSEAEKNDNASFLPGDAESTLALETTEELQGAELAPMVAIFRREGGLTADDRASIEQRISDFNEERAERARAEQPFAKTGDFQEVGQSDDAVLYTAAISAGDGQTETLLDPVELAREKLSDPGGGLEGKVTGPAGFSADAIEVFENISGTLLMAAGGLVFVLLILIYRSPFFFFIPLIAVAFAELASRAIGYFITEAGITVNGQSSSILSVLVLGAGTDYALLLVARYREELHRYDDKLEALAVALRQTGPSIIASALTVSAGLLCLSVAEVNGTAGLGPIGAMGVLVALVTMMTLLPALLAIVPRKAFWPLVPYGPSATPKPGRFTRFESAHRADETQGFWRRVGDRVAQRPARTGVAFGVALLVMCAGMANYSNNLTSADAYLDDVEAVEGQKLIERSFPAGSNAPADVIVPDPARVEAVIGALESDPAVAAVRPAAGVREDADATLLAAVLEDDPYSTAAFDAIPRLRRVAKEAGGDGVLIGGATAIEKDLRDLSASDTRLIVPMVLFVVFLILIGLLRAVVAPVLLISTVVLSFFASLGVGAVVFDVVFGLPGADPGIPLFAFVFLVALGIDYNIFLMARVREETLKHGTREGMLRGLAVTGGVITSAGIVLAGTFLVLALLPLAFLLEIGFLIAFGVLLDTFIVRSVLVPALVVALDKRVWWPSKLSR